MVNKKYINKTVKMLI